MSTPRDSAAAPRDSVAASRDTLDVSSAAAQAKAVDPDEFKNVVRTYIELYDEITTGQKQLHFLRKKKVEMSDTIVRFMREHDLDELKLSDGKLIRKTSKRVEALRKEHILETLKKVVGKDAESTMQMMFESRHVDVKDGLRRTRAGTS